MESTKEQITAWYYELAQAKNADGTYTQWAKCLSFTKPFVDPPAIKNLRLLISIPDMEPTNAQPQQPSVE